MLLISSQIFWQGHMHIIDVSQAVEPSQPNAIEFLRQDCVHVSVSFCLSHWLHCFQSNSFSAYELSFNYQTFGTAQDFFKKRGVAVMITRELFDFIVIPSIGEEAVDSYLDAI